MPNDADWVEDVRPGTSRVRSRPIRIPRTSPGGTDFAIGYEAAHPLLQRAALARLPANGFERSVY